ncbi:MAG: GH25 family lysozyme [Lachnospiraceae bacterium]|nr:GH25 family lysozyme [Lachnospiraceae bacterium]
MSFIKRAKAIVYGIADKILDWPLKTKIIASVLSGAIVFTSVGTAFVLSDRADLSQAEEPAEIIDDSSKPVAVKAVTKKEIVAVPSFQTVSLSGESMEKDLKIYFTPDEKSDSRIKGVPFSIKLISSKSEAGLEDALTAIKIDQKAISNASETGAAEKPYDENTFKEILSTARFDVTGKAEEATKNNTKDTSESTKGTSDKKSGETVSVEAESATDSSENKTLTELTKEDGTKVTILDELNVQLEMDIQAYATAVTAVKGATYTDEDNDGLIYLNKLKAGDVTVAYIPTDATKDYAAVSYLNKMTVKGKLEYKKVDVAKEIDTSAPDVAAPDRVVEATLKDTVEYVEYSTKKEARYVEAGVANAPQAGSASGSAVVTLSVKSSSRRKRGGYALHLTDPMSIFNHSAISTVGIRTMSQMVLLADNETGTVTAEQVAELEKKYKEALKEYEDAEAKAVANTSDPSLRDDAAKKKADLDTAKSNYDAANAAYLKQQDAAKEEEAKDNTPSSLTIQMGSVNNVTVYNTADGTGRTASFKVTPTATDGAGTNLTGTVTAVAASGDFKVSNNGNEITVTAGGSDVQNGTITYTVSIGNVTATGSQAMVNVVSSQALHDAEGNALYKDDKGTPATMADYKSGAKFYSKKETTTYYGWQSLNGKSYYYDKNGKTVSGEQVIHGVKYNFGSDGQLMISGTGIDVSKYQGNINWAAASSAISFAVVRVGYRSIGTGALNIDPKGVQNIQGAKAHGITTGAYFYSTAQSEAQAVEEASLAIQQVQAAGGVSMPIFIDWEGNSRTNAVDANTAAAIINAFCTTVRNSGYRAGLYSDKNHLTHKINMGNVSGGTVIWCAQYNTRCTYSGHYDMWQYTSKGSVPGIRGNVDMNQSFF